MTMLLVSLVASPCRALALCTLVVDGGTADGRHIKSMSCCGLLAPLTTLRRRRRTILAGTGNGPVRALDCFLFSNGQSGSLLDRVEKNKLNSAPPRRPISLGRFPSRIRRRLNSLDGGRVSPGEGTFFHEQWGSWQEFHGRWRNACRRVQNSSMMGPSSIPPSRLCGAAVVPELRCAPVGQQRHTSRQGVYDDGLGALAGHNERSFDAALLK